MRQLSLTILISQGINALVCFLDINVHYSPITQNFTITSAQATDLATGSYYFNINTMTNPGGEIRGQILLVYGATPYTDKCRFLSIYSTLPFLYNCCSIINRDTFCDSVFK